MGYKEEIYERAEKQFNTFDKVISWLSGFERPERGKTKYTETALKVRDELIDSNISLREKATEEEDYDKLKTLRKIEEKETFVDRDIISLINKRIKTISEELEKISKERKAQRLEEEEKQKERERIEKRKEDIQKDLETADTLSEVQRVKSRVERLRDEIPDEQISGLISQLELKEGEVRQQREDTQRVKYEEMAQSSDRRARSRANRWLREH